MGVAGVFHKIWRERLLKYDQSSGSTGPGVDGAMTKAPLGGAKTGPNPTDRAKGAKRSLLCEAQGVPIGLAHEGANRRDFKAASRDGRLDPDRTTQAQRAVPAGALPRPRQRLRQRPRPRSRAPVHPHIRTRGQEIKLKLRTPGWRAPRWIIEACHSWLNRNRALPIRWSKKDQNHLALLQLASGLIAFKKVRLVTLTATQPAWAPQSVEARESYHGCSQSCTHNREENQCEGSRV